MKHLVLLALLPLGCAAAVAPPVVSPAMQGANVIDPKKAHFTAAQVDTAIHAQESGGASNARTSSRGAVGGHQISPGTFTQYRQDHEALHNARDNATVGLRIVTEMMSNYDNDPARVAVAYFAGPGNVSRAGAKYPWIIDANDGNISTSQYVARVLRRLPKLVLAVPSSGPPAPGVPATVSK